MGSISIRDRLRTALEAIQYMPNAVAAWEDAHGGIRTLARKNAVKVREAEDLLAEVLASLLGGLTYEVHGLSARPLRYDSQEDLVEGLARHDIRYTGVSERRANQSPELRDRPTFDKLVGPMHGGPGVIRYETSDVYERLSR